MRAASRRTLALIVLAGLLLTSPASAASASQPGPVNPQRAGDGSPSTGAPPPTQQPARKKLRHLSTREAKACLKNCLDAGMTGTFCSQSCL